METVLPDKELSRNDGSKVQAQSIIPKANEQMPMMMTSRFSFPFLCLMVQKKRHKAYKTPKMQRTTKKKKEMMPKRNKPNIKVVGFLSLMTFSMPKRISGTVRHMLTVLGKPTMKFR